MRATYILRQASRGDTIAFIGVGQMGYHMSRNILLSSLSSPSHPHLKSPSPSSSSSSSTTPSSPGANLPDWYSNPNRPKRVLICDPSGENVKRVMGRLEEDLAGTGGKGGVEVGVVENPFEAALQASTIISMIPTHTHVQSVYTNPSSSSNAASPSSNKSNSSVLHAIQSGKLSSKDVEDTLCIEMSTIRIDVSREVGAAIEGAGAGWVDAPVSGGVVGAENASLTIMLGTSSPTTFDRAKPILSTLGRKVIRCGGLGMGLAAKLCNNMQLGISMLGLSEAMVLGKKLGLDSQILADIVNTSTGQCWASSVNHPVPGVSLPTFSSPPPANRDYSGGFITALAHKDLDLAVEAAAMVSSPLFVGALAEEVFRKVKGTEDWAGRDFSVVYRWLQEKVEEKGGYSAQS